MGLMKALFTWWQEQSPERKEEIGQELGVDVALPFQTWARGQVLPQLLQFYHKDVRINPNESVDEIVSRMLSEANTFVAYLDYLSPEGKIETTEFELEADNQKEAEIVATKMSKEHESGFREPIRVELKK